ncbi:bacillithiol system redox-active protein YtxJ [Paenibacillus yanchengensis]|uniref:Bacillithiol system redox-active protein YtxJ n=1 Tax=Paenibacillus yanchengensis TaxID=2035833 RepID=A0ABW4YGK8_9BACL
MSLTELTTLEQWEAVLHQTNERPAVILKHSTTCPVSSNAYNEFMSYLQDTPRTDVDYYLVKVIESRPVSNEIAEAIQIKHESPQVLMIDKQANYWNTSHWSVTKAHMAAVLD